MRAYLILADGHVFAGTSIGSRREVISEIVFNTSMTGYEEVLTDPSYSGQAVCMTYPLIGNYGICYSDQESLRPYMDGYIVHELSRLPSNFRSSDTIQNFLKRYNVPGVAGIDTRALTSLRRVFWNRSAPTGQAARWKRSAARTWNSGRRPTRRSAASRARPMRMPSRISRLSERRRDGSTASLSWISASNTTSSAHSMSVAAM